MSWRWTSLTNIIEEMKLQKEKRREREKNKKYERYTNGLSD